MNVLTDPRREFAARVKPDPIDPRGRAYKVVDTDFHLLPEWSDLRKYMKEPFKSELTNFPLAGGDYSPKYAIGLEGTGQETQGRARSAADILRVIDEIAVDTVIITPGFTRPQSMFHQAMVTATAAAYNDFLIHEVFPASPRIKAEIMINHRNPADGAAEIRRVGDHPGFVGVYTEFGGNYEPIGTARHDPIFEAAVEHDLVVTSHIGMFWQKATPLAEGTRTWTELVGISAVSISIAYVGSMIMQGLFDKYPTLTDGHQGRRLLVATGIHGARRRLLSQPSRRHQAGRAQVGVRRKIPLQVAQRIFREQHPLLEPADVLPEKSRALQAADDDLQR